MVEKFNTTKNEVPGTPVEKESSLAEKLEISEAKNRELKVENEELKKKLEDEKNKLENIKKLFLAMAHDLKGPISTTTVSIKLLLGYIEDVSITMEELGGNLGVICKSNEATEKLLEDLLTRIRLQLDGIKPEILAEEKEVK